MCMCFLYINFTGQFEKHKKMVLGQSYLQKREETDFNGELLPLEKVGFIKQGWVFDFDTINQKIV